MVTNTNLSEREARADTQGSLPHTAFRGGYDVGTCLVV
jgi:hypothetical protein